MAANEYYNPRLQQPTQPYNNFNAPPPSYQSQPPSQIPSRTPSAAQHGYDTTSPVSPFEAPFDDHVYPAGQPPVRPVRPYDSQSTLGANSYQGVGGRQGLSHADSYDDNIPLRDHPGAPNAFGKDAGPSTDHVYDATDPAAPVHLEEGRHRKQGFGGMARFTKSKKRIPWVVYILTVAQIGVFIGEIVKNAQLTGSPIEIHPSFNPMIGPSPYVLINMGARFVPCMHAVDGVQNRKSGSNIVWPCPSTTTTSGNCTLSELCGFNMPTADNPIYPDTTDNTSLSQYTPQPNQWFRFILPMFLHAGIVHIGFNMLLQMTLGKEMEVAIGPIRFFLVYVCAGIFGFVLGGNYAATGIASTGASGSLFGVMALTLLDLLYTWKDRTGPWKDFAFIMLDVVISFVLGLLPGLDNFSHIGGFFMGLVLGICILHSPNSLRARTNQDEPPYEPVKAGMNGEGGGITSFVKSPVGFFKGRKPAWWAWWLVRVAGLVFVLIVFILLLNNFYVYRKTCSWCKYLSCINVNNWCDIGNLNLTDGTTSSTNTTSKRDVFADFEAMKRAYEGAERVSARVMLGMH